MKNQLKVVEIFNSIQGEGANMGCSATFVRLSDCNMNCEYCDTSFTDGKLMTTSEIKNSLEKFNAKLIVWTGGEPTLQLTDEILKEFPTYTNAIETNGTKSVPSRIDYISCSPKVSIDVLKKNLKQVDEFRFPIAKGDFVPLIDELPKAKHYFLSPIFKGKNKNKTELDKENLNYCLEIISKEPRWRLSVQLHKLLNIE